MTRHSTCTKWAHYSPKLNPFSVYKMTSHRQRLTMAVFSILDFAEYVKISNLPVIAMMTASLEVFQVSSSFTASQFRCPICSRRGGFPDKSQHVRLSYKYHWQNSRVSQHFHSHGDARVVFDELGVTETSKERDFKNAVAYFW